MRLEVFENLQEILQRGVDIQVFVSTMTFEDYTKDARTRLAVERAFEIIGEALNRSSRLAPELTESIPNYRKVISFRNILAHCYDSIEDRLVWGFIEGSLPQLLDAVQKLIQAES